MNCVCCQIYPDIKAYPKTKQKWEVIDLHFTIKPVPAFSCTGFIHGDKRIWNKQALENIHRMMVL